MTKWHKTWAISFSGNSISPGQSLHIFRGEHPFCGRWTTTGPKCTHRAWLTDRTSSQWLPPVSKGPTSDWLLRAECCQRALQSCQLKRQDPRRRRETTDDNTGIHINNAFKPGHDGLNCFSNSHKVGHMFAWIIVNPRVMVFCGWCASLQQHAVSLYSSWWS